MYTIPGTYHQVEARIQEALTVFSNGFNGTIAQLARQFRVPYPRLYARIKGRGSRSQRPATNLRLTEAGELSIQQYITRCDKLRMPVLFPQLVAAFQTVFDLNDPRGRADPIGRNFVSRWLARNPQYRRVRQKPQELSRIASNTEAVYQKHFDDLDTIMADFGITRDDCWNMDETGFRIGVGGSQWIITMDYGRETQSPSITCRDYSTAIEAVSATGVVLPGFLILTGAVHLAKWYTQTTVPDDYLIAVSESGYTNDELSLEWLKHFNKWSAKSQKGRWRLLIFDGFGSHSTKEFLDYADEHQIVCFTLPPHTSHNLQPLDVGVFRPFKHHHKAAVEAATRSGCTEFNKLEFLQAISSIRDATFKQSTIKSGWAQAGIWPWDPQKALHKVQEELPTTPPPTSSCGSTPTPQTQRTLKQFIEDTRAKVADNSASVNRILRLAKAATALADLHELTVKELESLTAAARERKERQAASRRQVQKGGVLTAKDARMAVEKRMKDEAKRAAATAARKAKKE